MSGIERGKRILVCGGRDFKDIGLIDRVMSAFEPAQVICGGCRGTDFIAEEWARTNNVNRRIFYADWGRHGRAAGPIRNQRMLKEGSPEVVVAFPGGRGTADMVDRAIGAGVPVLRVFSDGRACWA